MSRSKRQIEYKRSSSKASKSINGATFTMARHDLLTHSKFKKLSLPAKTVLFYLFGQYNQLNNGDLSAPITALKEYGIKSSTTLRKAINELIEADILILSRQGGRNHKPNLYALTCFPINKCLDKNGKSKIDLASTNRPADSWKREVKN